MTAILVWGRSLVLMGEVPCGGKKKERPVVEVTCRPVRGKRWRGRRASHRHSHHEAWCCRSGLCDERWSWWLRLKPGSEMKKPAPGRVRVFEEFRCVCCLHAGSSRTCGLGNKYEHKNRTQRGGADGGGFDVGSRWRVVMQHAIERNTGVLAVSTLTTVFLSVSSESSEIACAARMVATESVSVNPNSLLSTRFLRGFRVAVRHAGADLGRHPPKGHRP